MVDLGQIYLCSSLTTRGLLFNDPTLRHARSYPGLGRQTDHLVKIILFLYSRVFPALCKWSHVNVGKENSIFIKFVGGSLEDLSVLIHI